MNNDRSCGDRDIHPFWVIDFDISVGVLEMNMHEECLKRQNEGYHTPLSEVIERIERDSRKLKPSYAVLDIQDALFYLREYHVMVQKLFWNEENRYWILYGNYQDYLKAMGKNEDENA